MDIVFKMMMLVDHESNSDKKINKFTVQTGEDVSGSLVYNITVIHTPVKYIIFHRN